MGVQGEAALIGRQLVDARAEQVAAETPGEPQTLRGEARLVVDLVPVLGEHVGALGRHVAATPLCATVRALRSGPSPQETIRVG